MKGETLMSLRSLLYQLARFLGDINAMGKGKIGRRIINKGIGRGAVSKIYLKKKARRK